MAPTVFQHASGDPGTPARSQQKEVCVQPAGKAHPWRGPLSNTIQAVLGKVTQDPGDQTKEIYFYDRKKNESYGIDQADLPNVQIGDIVDYNTKTGRIKKLVSRPTVAEIALEQAKDQGIKSDIVLSLLLDLQAEDLKKAREADLLKKYTRDWTSFTACYQTADSLFNLLRKGDAKFETSATRSKESIQIVTKLLVDSITTNASQGAIYRIRFGIHGFIVLARNGTVELIQSFAGRSGGEMLAKSLKDKRHILFRVSRTC